MNYEELFDKEAEILHPDLPKLIDKPTFLRICEEIRPKWTNVEDGLPELKYTHEKYQKSDLLSIKLKGDKRLYSAQLETYDNSEKYFYIHEQDENIEIQDVELWFDLPPLPEK